MSAFHRLCEPGERLPSTDLAENVERNFTVTYENTRFKKIK